MQSSRMNSNEAAQHLEVIRTLMERSSVYRLALAPPMVLAGNMGTLGALIALRMKIESGPKFALFWMGVCLVTVIGSLLLIRRQAVRAGEEVWSTPARRVAFSALPCLVLGGVSGWIVHLSNGTALRGASLWLGFYGCALHAAGFFTVRGMRLMGWILILIALLGLLIDSGLMPLTLKSPGNFMMGLGFGISHLAYGAYLKSTEPKTGLP